jgi:hypothetical protein
MIVASSITIAETLPNSAVATCGTSVNLGIVTGILLISIVQTFSLPASPLDSNYLTTNGWKFCFMFPAITAVFNILMWHFLIKRDPIEQMIISNVADSELME